MKHMLLRYHTSQLCDYFHMFHPGYWETDEYLLSKGTNVDTICQDGEASLRIAACHEHARMLELLPKHNPNVDSAIGRVASVDSGLWWIILLRAYTRWTGDSLAESPNCQRAMHLILRLCLSEGCDTSPALLCADGCSMIDRRMVGAHLQLLLFFIVIVDNTPRACFLRFSRILLFYCIISSRISIRIETGLPIR